MSLFYDRVRTVLDSVNIFQDRMIDIIVQIEVYKKALKAQTCLSVATRYENELRSLESEYSILLAKITIEPEVCKT